MKLSARNQLEGVVKSVQHGAVNSEVVIELPGGTLVTAVVTKSSAESLGLEPGRRAYAVVKASNVMVGVDHQASAEGPAKPDRSQGSSTLDH